MTSSVKPDQAEKRQVGRQTQSFPLYGLLCLSAAIFISMATEFLPGGLIPQIATEFGRSPAEAGNLITVFALTVIITTAPLAVLARRVPRKTMVLVSFALIGAGNLGTVFAPSFELLLAARILGAVAHGAFWSVVAVYPAHMVRPTQLGKATAVTAAGGSLAGVLGIPLGNALGQAFGWRTSFAVLAGLVVVTFLLMAWRLPAVATPQSKTSTKPGPAQRDHTLPLVLLVCALIMLVISAQSSFSTFGVVWLVDIAHLEPAVIPVLLFVGGAASALGVALTGTLYTRWPLRLFLGALAALVGLLASLPALAGSQAAVWIVWAAVGTVFGGVPVMLQTRMMVVASLRARNIAAALQTTAINLGIGGGAFLGGIVIEHTSLAALPHWAAGAMALAFAVAAAGELIINRKRRKEVGADALHG
jgi:MFS transporter, DHA1 family, inner membrane transport protein